PRAAASASLARFHRRAALVVGAVRRSRPGQRGSAATRAKASLAAALASRSEDHASRCLRARASRDAHSGGSPRPCLSAIERWQALDVEEIRAGGRLAPEFAQAEGIQ